MRIVLIVLLMASVAQAEVKSDLGNIAGKYTWSGYYSCMYDDGKEFEDDRKNDNIKVAYKETGIYDLYYIFHNDKHVGYIYVGPHSDSKKAFYIYYDEWGYLILKQKKLIKVKRAVHATITDAWKDGREYSCKVRRDGYMTEKVDYVIKEEE